MPTQTFFNLSQDKKDKIMDAVIDELSIHDYDAFNISNIIRKTQMARGSFYQYFIDKDDIYDYFMNYIKNLKFAYYGSLFNPEHDIPFIDRMIQIYEKGMQFRNAYPKLIDVGNKMIQSDYFKKDPHYKTGRQMLKDLFTSFVKKDVELSRIRSDIDTMMLVELTTLLLDHLASEWLFEQTYDEKTIHSMLKRILDIIKKGIEPHV